MNSTVEHIEKVKKCMPTGDGVTPACVRKILTAPFPLNRIKTVKKSTVELSCTLLIAYREDAYQFTLIQVPAAQQSTIDAVIFTLFSKKGSPSLNSNKIFPASSKDEVMPIEGRADVDVGPEKMCKYGEHNLHIGQSLNSLGDKCVVCTCKQPPIVECINNSDCYRKKIDEILVSKLVN